MAWPSVEALRATSCASTRAPKTRHSIHASIMQVRVCAARGVPKQQTATLTAEHGAVPHRRVGAKLHVPQHVGVHGNERGLVLYRHNNLLQLEQARGHGRRRDQLSLGRRTAAEACLYWRPSEVGLDCAHKGRGTRACRAAMCRPPWQEVTSEEAEDRRAPDITRCPEGCALARPQLRESLHLTRPMPEGSPPSEKPPCGPWARAPSSSRAAPIERSTEPKP